MNLECEKIPKFCDSHVTWTDLGRDRGRGLKTICGMVTGV